MIVHTLKNNHLMNKGITVAALWDKIGLSVSGICAIHCLLFPIFITTLPLWPMAFTIHEWAHPMFIATLAPVTYYASKRSYFEKGITVALATGFFLILTGWLVGHYLIGLWFESAVTLLGSGILIAGHWMNYQHHRNCKNKNHEHHPEVKNLEVH
jgi:hypothetical protein